MGGVELRFLRIVSTVLVHQVAENGSTETETKPHYGSQEQGNTDGVGNIFIIPSRGKYGSQLKKLRAWFWFWLDITRQSNESGGQRTQPAL